MPEKKQPKPEYSQEFLEFYAVYPRPVAKKRAWDAWKKEVMKCGVEPSTVMSILRTTIAVEWRGRTKDYIPYPASWLRAEAFEERETEALADDREVLPSVRQRPGDHFCQFCNPPHLWRIENEPFGGTFEMACPLLLRSLK